MTAQQGLLHPPGPAVGCLMAKATPAALPCHPPLMCDSLVGQQTRVTLSEHL